MSFPDIAPALEWLWLAAGLACLGAAAAAALGRPLPRLERLGSRPLAAAGLVLPALLAAFKLGQFHHFQLMWDSGVTVNLAWNILHGHGIRSSVIGDASYLAVHFAFAVGLLSPLLLLWNSAGVLALAQGALVGSAAAGTYLVAERIVRDRLLSLLLAILVVSTPFFHDLTFCVLDNSVLAFPFSVWALWAWLSGRRALAFVLALALISTREQVPFALAGLGAHVLLSARTRRGKALGAALAAGSAALFLGELALIRGAQRAWTDPGNYWSSTFSFLGGSPEAVTRNALTRPWLFAAALVWPPAKLWTVAKVLLSFAGLPLLAGSAALPALAVWLPNQLADPGAFHSLHSHTCAYLFGPLVWAAAVGLERAARRELVPRRILCAILLAVSAAGFLRGARYRHPAGINPAHWPETGPRALSFVPADAKVWCDEFFLPHLAARRYVKTLPRTGDAYFAPRPFEPDRVLLSTHWVRVAEPAVRDPILAYLKKNRYAPVFAEKDLVVLARPGMP